MATDEVWHDNPDNVPPKERDSSKIWLATIADAEREYKDYHEKADNIDKLYADLLRLSTTTRDRQFQLFWANIQVLAPSIYSRPPVPVVVPRFKDRKPIPRLTSEILERSSIVMFEAEDIDHVMHLVRDDLVITARGVVWLRYEKKGGGLDERVCIEHVDRKDFLHEPARTWREVGWVAKRSWLTKKEMRDRFKDQTAEVLDKAAYSVRKDKESGDGLEDRTPKAAVWEIWSKSDDQVVWVTEGIDTFLDDDKPHLDLAGFFPCPRPAYATVERRTLVPVPDMVFYKDQLEEINALTARIGALTDAVKVRGFYPAGAGEIGDAIEAAIKNISDNQVLIPVANWAMIGSGGVKDMIVWLPLDMIAQTVTSLVALRKQLIDDVYQITGLSDIMRGSTVASETLGAQELKSQYGSIRIRDRQNELVRIARDITVIAAEIMAENFEGKTLLDMSQMDVPSDADVAKQVRPLEQQIRDLGAQFKAIDKTLTDTKKAAAEAMSDPKIKALAEENPEQSQQLMAEIEQQTGMLEQQAAQLQEQGGQLQAQIDQLKQTVTIEKVMKFLRDQRIRPYVLDIETDSTIAPDENATKQRATEYVTAVGGFMSSAFPLVQAMPQAAPVVADVLKYVASQFRAGRLIEQSIEELGDQMKEMAQQPRGPDPAQQQAEAEAAAAQAKQQMDAQKTEAEAQEKTANAQALMAETQNKMAQAEHDRKLALAEAVDAANARKIEIEGKFALNQQAQAHAAEKHAREIEIAELNIALLETKIHQADVATDNAIATTDAKIEGQEAASAAKAANGTTGTPGTTRAPRPPRAASNSALTDLIKSLQTQQAASNAAMVAAMTAPKEIIRDASGSPVGVRTIGG